MPWIEDARVFQGIDDVRNADLYETQEISEFLNSVDSSRTVVMAPKGCGKTLLILYKRQLLEKTKNYKLIPENQLVAVAPGQARPFDNDDLRHIQEHPQFWATLWQLSIAIATLKAHGRTISDGAHSKLVELMENDHLNDPFLNFANLLLINTKEYYRLQQDFQSSVLPAYKSVRSQTALFIDNVDEFFQNHLNEATRHPMHGQLDRDIWHHAQIGLLLATRMLTAQNSHVKIYASIRTEAYNACKEEIPDIANLRAHILRVVLTPTDLQRIFEQNIAVEDPAHLVDPQANDLWTRFVGKENLFIRQTFTGRIEPIFSYILRHTHSRPRDLMTVGSLIRAIPPEERTAQRIRDAVNDAAVSLCESFLIETSPHYFWFNQDALFANINSNVFDGDELKALGETFEASQNDELSSNYYKQDDGVAEVATGDGALDDLYSCGLLGAAVSRPTGKGKVQAFESIYNVSGKYSNRSVNRPIASRYLIHPLLGSYLRRRYSCIGDNVDSLNVITPGGDWVEANGLGYILQADICNFSEILKDADRKDIFKEVFRNILDEARDGIEIVEHHEGDRLLLGDQSGYLLVQAARKIADGLNESMFSCKMRFGLDFGAFRTESDRETGESKLLANTLAQKSARLEQVAAPGYMLMKPHVFDALDQYNLDLPAFSLLEPDIADDVKFKVRKVKDGWRYGKSQENNHAASLIAIPIFDVNFE